MNYFKIYSSLVRRAFHSKRKRDDDNYYEGHHVKPDCFGGTRIVLLTAREHYIAHFLLYKHFKLYGNTNKRIKMARAWNAMTFSSSDNIERYTSRTFEYARIAFNESMKGDNHPNYGKSTSQETLDKIANTMKNKPQCEIDTMKEKQRQAKLGSKWSVEHRENALSGRRKHYENKQPQFELIKPDGSKHLYTTLSKLLKDHNMSKSMIYNNVFGNVIQYGDKQSKIRSEKTENSIGCIVNKLNNCLL